MTPTVAAGVEHVIVEPAATAANGESPTLFFMHGLGGDWSNWLPQLATFGERYRCLSWTMPGYGDSEPLEPMDWSTLADRAVELLDHHDIDQATLIGLSMGGMVAQQLAADHGDRLDDLVLVATSPSFGRPGNNDFVEKYLAARYAPLDAGKTPADLAPGVVEGLLGPTPVPEARQNCVASMSRITSDAYRRAVECLTTWAFDHRLGEISARTLCIAGADDRTAPVSSVKRLADGIATSRLEVVESCGHLVNLDRPDEFNALLADFLT